MKAWIVSLIGLGVAVTIALFAGPLIERAVHAMQSPDRWLMVGSVEVEDAEVGEAPKVRMKREVRRTFSGERIATLLRRTGGGFEEVCSRASHRLYVAGAALPETTDIDLFLDLPMNTSCPRMEPGQYVLKLAWIIQSPGLPMKIVSAESNIFTVTQ